MSRRKKIYLWVAGSIGVLLILLLALMLLLPRLINLETLREKIIADVSQTVGGVVEFEKIDLSFFPRPHVVIRQASLSVPGKASGTLESLGVYPKILLSLLTAKLHVAKLQVKAPDFKIRLPDGPEKKGKGREAFSLEAVKEKVTSDLAVATLKAPGLEVVVVNGRLDFLRKDKSAFRFRDIRARVGLPPGKLKVNVTCESNLWDDISLNGWMDVGDFETSGSVDLTNFRPHILSADLLSLKTLRVGDSELNLDIEFKTEGLKVLQGKVHGSIPYLTLHKGDKKLVIKGKSLKGDFHLDKEKTMVSLAELNLGHPQLNVSGKLSVDKASPQTSLALEGKDVDVDSVREVALALLGDYSVTHKIFDIVKGGQVPFIAFNTGGSSMRDLGKLEKIKITGNMLEGKITVPACGLNVQDVKGDVAISKGILQGKNMEGQLGKSKAWEGSLRIGLRGKDAPFHLDLGIQGDLTQNVPVLKCLIKNESFTQQINLLDDLKGNVTGRLVLGETLTSIKTRINVSQFNLTAKYQPIPYPLEVSQGQFLFDGSKVNVKGLDGKLGKSSFSGLSAGIDWSKEPYLEVESKKSSILLDEIYPWLLSFEGLREELKSLGTVKGTVTLSPLSLKGPLRKPESWSFETEGEVKDLAVDTSLFSGPIRATQGKFKATPEKLSFTGLRADFLDASINGDGTLDGYLKGFPEVDMSFEGEMRSESIKWLAELIKLPPDLIVRSPLSISQAHLTREKNGKTSFLGNLTVPNGPKVSMDVIQDGGELKVKDALVTDKESKAAITFNRREGDFDFAFSGDLRKTTLDSFLVQNRFLAGWVKGDFQATVDMDQPARSTANGKLKAENIILPWIVKIPAKIDNFHLYANENNLNVESAVFSLGENRMTLSGDAKALADGILLDMDLLSNEIEWDNVKKVLDEDREETEVKKADDSWDLPVRGVLRLKTESFTYSNYSWKPLHADISFDRDRVSVGVRTADLCGVSMPGSIDFSPGKVQLDLKPKSERQELDSALACLANKKGLVVGKFDFDGNVTAKARHEDVLKSLKGNLRLDTDGGRIYRWGLLAKVFAILNVTEVFSGRLPDLTKEGFAYDSATVQAEFQGDKLVLKEMVIDSPSMGLACLGNIDLINKKLDLKILVAPLKTVDSVVKKIPLVNHILGGTLVSIPIKVEGVVGDPTVTPLSPSAVGSGLMGIMKRTLELPFKIIEPRAPVD